MSRACCGDHVCARCGAEDVTSYVDGLGALCARCESEVYDCSYDDDELGIDPEAKWARDFDFYWPANVPLPNPLLPGPEFPNA